MSVAQSNTWQVNAGVQQKARERGGVGKEPKDGTHSCRGGGRGFWRSKDG